MRILNTLSNSNILKISQLIINLCNPHIPLRKVVLMDLFHQIITIITGVDVSVLCFWCPCFIVINHPLKFVYKITQLIVNRPKQIW